MRSYSQYCSVAKALDLLGERWTLLLVRELLARGACRYTDLRDGLPGIATNLLADRLRDLGRWGVPLMRASAPDDQFRGQWLRLPVRMFLADREPQRPASTVEVRAADQTVVIHAAAGKVSMRLGADPNADAVLTASPPEILSLMSGAVTLRQAVKRGLQVEGSRAAVERILPERPRVVAT